MTYSAEGFGTAPVSELIAWRWFNSGPAQSTGIEAFLLGILVAVWLWHHPTVAGVLVAKYLRRRRSLGSILPASSKIETDEIP